MKLSKKGRKLIRNFILCILLIMVGSSFYSTFAQIREYKKQIASLNEQIAKEDETNKELNKIKKKIHSDENYKEIARNTLGLVDPGDKVYVNSNDNRNE